MVIDGTLDHARAASTLAARLPEAIRPLARVAYNYSWSWTEDGRALLHDLDPHRWELTSGNMVSFLEQRVYQCNACMQFHACAPWQGVFRCKSTV